MRGDGSGQFSEAAAVNVGMNPEAIQSGDLNGDGQIDLVVADGVPDQTVSVLLANP